MANNSYNEYVKQLEKYKASEKNDINNANLKAKTYLDNYKKALGLANSGAGMSADIQLAQNANEQLANVNKTYDQRVLDYRNQYNTDKITQAKELLGGMTSDDRNAYLENLASDNGLNTETYDYISAYKNALSNQEAETKRQNAINTAKNYIDSDNTTSGEIKNYLETLRKSGQYDDDTMNSLQDYFDMSGKSWKAEAQSSYEDIAKTIAAASNGGDTEMADKLTEIQNEIVKAVNYGTKEDYQKALSKLEEANKVEVPSTAIKAADAKTNDFGSFAGSGNSNSKQSKYVNQILDAAKEGKLENGAIINFNYGLGNAKLYQYVDNGTDDPYWAEVSNISMAEANDKKAESKKILKKLGIKANPFA